MKFLWADHLKVMEKKGSVPLTNFIKISGILENTNFEPSNDIQPQYDVNYLKRGIYDARDSYSPPSKVLRILDTDHPSKNLSQMWYDEYKMYEALERSSPNGMVSSTQLRSPVSGNMCKKPQQKINQSECNKIQPHLVLQRFLEKVKSSENQNTGWIERELSVKELRQIIPLLMIKAFDSKCVPALRKVKGIWEKAPDGWPEELPYCDPNNGNKAFGKPRKDILVKIVIFLLQRLKNSEDRKAEDVTSSVSSTCDNSNSSTSSELNQAFNDRKNQIDPQITPTKKMPSLIRISSLSPIGNDIEKQYQCDMIVSKKQFKSPLSSISSDSCHNLIAGCTPKNIQESFHDRSPTISVSPHQSKEESTSVTSYKSYTHSYSFTESPRLENRVKPYKIHNRSISHCSDTGCSPLREYEHCPTESYKTDTIKGSRYINERNQSPKYLTSSQMKESEHTSRERYMTDTIKSGSYFNERNLSSQYSTTSLDESRNGEGIYTEIDSERKRGSNRGSRTNDWQSDPQTPKSTCSAKEINEHNGSKLLQVLMNQANNKDNGSCSLSHRSYDESVISNDESDDRDAESPAVEIDPIENIYNRVEEKVHFIHWKGWLENKQLTLLYLTLGDFGKVRKNTKKEIQEEYLDNVHSFESTLDLILIRKKMLANHEKRWQKFLTYENKL